MEYLRVNVFCKRCGRIDEVVVKKPESLDTYALDHGDHVLVFTIDKNGVVRSTYIYDIPKGGDIEFPVKELSLNVRVPKVNGIAGFAFVQGEKVVVVFEIDGNPLMYKVFDLVESRMLRGELAEIFALRGPEFLASIVYQALTKKEVEVPADSIKLAEKVLNLLGLRGVSVSEGSPPNPPASFIHLFEKVLNLKAEDKIGEIKKMLGRIRGALKLIIHICRTDLPPILIRDLLAEKDPLEVSVILDLLGDVDKVCKERAIGSLGGAS